MSTSQKLLVLGETLKYNPTLAAEQAEDVLLAALPQIVAVVEAAEDFGAWPDHQSPDWPALTTALAALDEALS